MPPLFPQEHEEKPQGVNIRLPRALWRELDEIAQAEQRSRNYVVEFFLAWAVDDYRQAKREQEAKTKSKK